MFKESSSTEKDRDVGRKLVNTRQKNNAHAHTHTHTHATGMGTRITRMFSQDTVWAFGFLCSVCTDDETDRQAITHD